MAENTALKYKPIQSAIKKRHTSCLREHHKPIQQAIHNVIAFQPYQFGGMVYGERRKFCETLCKSKNDYFNIHPDGRIERIVKDRGMTITSSGGLSSHVLMPGKYIAIEDTSQINLQELRHFRSVKTTRSIADDFELKYNDTPRSR